MVRSRANARPDRRWIYSPLPGHLARWIYTRGVILAKTPNIQCPLMRAKRTRRGMTSCPVLGPNADVVGILRCTALLLDLMLVIRAQGKHSSGVTFPDRLIGVDDVNSPLSTPAFAEIS